MAVKTSSLKPIGREGQVWRFPRSPIPRKLSLSGLASSSLESSILGTVFIWPFSELAPMCCASLPPRILSEAVPPLHLTNQMCRVSCGSIPWQSSPLSSFLTRRFLIGAVLVLVLLIDWLTILSVWFSQVPADILHYSPIFSIEFTFFLLYPDKQSRFWLPAAKNPNGYPIFHLTLRHKPSTMLLNIVQSIILMLCNISSYLCAKITLAMT